MFLTNRFYAILATLTVLTGLGYAFPPLFFVGKILLCLFAVILLIDIAMLYSKKGIKSSRDCSERFSNGDDNEVNIFVGSTYLFPVNINVIDEIPPIFQRRDISFRVNLKPIMGKTIHYFLRPTQRGVYSFGKIRIFASTVIGLVERRYTQGEPIDVKVYPSYLMLTKYELLAINNNLTEFGIKKIRRAGNNTEFEQIKEYVKGDEYRSINWKASARRHQLMINVYQDERSQQIYNIVDKGRVMQQAFERMTLLDYAINASLVLSYVAIRREDKAGLLTFADRFDSFVPAAKKPGHMQILLESLYSQQTTFGETDFSGLCAAVNKHIRKRSLLVLYTNFSGMTAMKRQLSYLKQLSNRHRLLVVFFEDAELRDYIAVKPKNTEEYYQHVITEKFAEEKRLIVSTLKQNGIISLLTTPKNLSIDVINKYIEMKAKNLLT